MNSRKSSPGSLSAINDTKAMLPENDLQGLKQVAQQNQAHNIGLKMLAISSGIDDFELPVAGKDRPDPFASSDDAS